MTKRHGNALKVCLLVLVALVLFLPATAQAVLHVGDAAPDFSIPDTAWVNHQLSGFRGSVVHLMFWQAF